MFLEPNELQSANVDYASENFDISRLSDLDPNKVPAFVAQKEHLRMMSLFTPEREIPVILKLFIKRADGFDDSFMKELLGIRLCSQRDIPTLPLWAHGRINGVGVTMREYSPEYTPIHQGDVSYEFALREGIKLILACQTKAGFIHGDPDSTNVLIGPGGDVVIIDFGQMQPNPLKGIEISELYFYMSMLALRMGCYSDASINEGREIIAEIISNY